MTEEIKELKIISTKDLGYTKKDLQKMTDGKGAEKIFLARITGVVQSVVTGEGKQGVWHMLKGMFFAINKDGMRFQSPNAFLPKNITKNIIENFSQGVIEIELPITDIFVTESEKSGVGYQFECNVTLTDDVIKKASILSDKLFSSKLPQLAAPKAQNKKAS